MSNRENHESGPFSMITVAFLAIVICAVAVLLMPAKAGTEATAATFSATSDYLPAQYVNQGKDGEPAVQMYE